MAITYRGERDGPPAKDSGRWIEGREFNFEAIKQKEVQHIYFRTLRGQAQHAEPPQPDAPEIWNRPAPKPSSSKGYQDKKQSTTVEEKGFTYREALEGKPKSKSMPKPSGPQVSMPELDLAILVSKQKFTEDDFTANIFAHATTVQGADAIIEDRYMIPAAQRGIPKGRIHNHVVDLTEYIYSGDMAKFPFKDFKQNLPCLMLYIYGAEDNEQMFEKTEERS